MKILFIANHLNVGGITSYLLTLATGLLKRGHRVYLASAGGKRLAGFLESGVECIHIPIRTKNELSWRLGISAYRLAGVIDSERIDLIHAQTRTTQVLGSLLSRWKKTPFISTCHGFFNNRRLFRKLFPCWGRKVIAVSESVRDHLRDDFKVNERDIEVVRNGIDDDEIRRRIAAINKDEVRRSFGIRRGPVIGNIGRLSDVKGQVYLIRAMPEVLQAFPDAQLLIAGEGKMKPTLEQLARQLGVEKNVVFIRDLKTMETGLAITDVFVMPSLKEGLGLALMEAMAAGCPVVGSDVGGIRSLIRDNVTGLLAKPAQPPDIASAIIRILGDGALGERLAEGARRHISEEFSQEHMVGATERVYEQCLG